MAFNYESEFIFIGRGDESFLENYSYEKIYMALEILNNQAEAEDIGEVIFANFKQKFYESTNGDPYQRFEEALKEVNRAIETLKEEKVSHFIGNLNIAIGAVVEDTLYLSTVGDAEVYLVRKKFVSAISEGLAEESKKETFVNIANGTLEPFDRIVFSSTRLLRYITKGELGRIFSNAGSAKIGNELAELQDFIMTEILGRSAVIGIAVAAALQEGQEEDEGVFEEEGSVKARFLGIVGRITGAFSFMKKIPGLSSIREKITGIIPEKFLPLQSQPKPKLPKIKFPKEMSRERLLLIIIILLVVLVGGVFWVRTQGSARRAIAEHQSKLNHVQELMNDAVTTGQFDKTKAAELLIAGEKEALDVLNSRYLRGEAVKMLDEIQKQRDGLDEVKRVTPTLLADFSEKRPNVSTLGLLNLKDHLYGFEYNALYEMVLDKLQEPLTMSDVETVILGAAYPEGNSLLFLTRTGKMLEFTQGRFPQVTTKDGIWKKGVDMKSYNDRVYILDPERNQIWRYIRRRDGFDEGQQYNQNADLSKAVSLAIDSSIYALNADGTVIQLYQGQKQEYPLRRAPLSAIEAPTKIYTSPELNHIFILEPNKQRVVLFRKDSKNGGAQYQTQYVFEKTGALRDFVVADSRLYVMDDKRVYFINLSGL
ncbi:hypothetical protein HYW83_04530 [Candidatus Peregrinibacteria bacterium]|nr:hypothetical protein [Candidatus Peregrinibacteria bacterium]